VSDFKTEARLEDPDQLYYRLAQTSATLDESRRLDFALRLVLLLANEIGTLDTVAACIEEAARPFKAPLEGNCSHE
jgi:hypothetical protein